MTRWLLLALALVISGCSLFRVNTPPVAVPVAAAPSSAALPAREIVFAVNSLAPSIEAAVNAGTLPRAEAIRQLTALRTLVAQVDRLSSDLAQWSHATDPETRAQRKADAVARLHAMGGTFAATPDWKPVIDAYVRTVLTVGEAQ